MADEPRTVTRLLRAWRDGDRGAFDELVPLVYGQLRDLAGVFLRDERPGHTMRATDLVSEAYLRMVGAAPAAWNDRVHFFAVAARAMRQILVEHARRRSARKRGGGGRAITLDELLVGVDRPDELVWLDEALDALAIHDPRKAQVVELHYFGGLSQIEVAEVLELHVNTVARDLRFAEAWIHRHLTS